MLLGVRSVLSNVSVNALLRQNVAFIRSEPGGLYTNLCGLKG